MLNKVLAYKISGYWIFARFVTFIMLINTIDSFSQGYKSLIHGRENINSFNYEATASVLTCGKSLPYLTYLNGKSYLDPNAGIETCSGTSSGYYGWTVYQPLGYSRWCGHDKLALSYDNNILDTRVETVNYKNDGKFTFFTDVAIQKIDVTIKQQNFFGNFSLFFEYGNWTVKGILLSCENYYSSSSSYYQNGCVLKTEGVFGYGGIQSASGKLDYNNSSTYTVSAYSGTTANVNFFWNGDGGYCNEVFDGGQMRYLIKTKNGQSLNTYSSWTSVSISTDPDAFRQFNRLISPASATMEVGDYTLQMEIKDRFGNQYSTPDFYVNVVPSCYSETGVTFAFPGAEEINGGYNGANGGYKVEKDVEYVVQLYNSVDAVFPFFYKEIENFDQNYEILVDDGGTPPVAQNNTTIEFKAAILSPHPDNHPGKYKLKVHADIGSYRIYVKKKDYLGPYCYEYKPINLFVGGSNITRESPCLIQLPADFPEIFPELSSGFARTMALSHFTYEVKSHKGVIVKPGVHLKEGAILQVETIPEPEVPAEEVADKTKNWAQTRIFDDVGYVIGESRKYFNEKGLPIQNQYKDLSRKVVMASEALYDKFGRPAIATLPAPVNVSTLTDAVDQCGDYIQTGQDMYFSYMDNFVTVAGNKLSYNNFDQYTPVGEAPVQKFSTPDLIDSDTPGTLGWYYSNLNLESSRTVLEAEGKAAMLEPLTPATIYPYVRTIYQEDGTNRIKGSTLPGDYHHAGSGRYSETKALPLNVQDVQIIDDYLEVREKLFPGSVNLPLADNCYKVVSKDIEGKEIITYLDKGDKVLISVDPAADIKSYNIYDVPGRLVCSVTPMGVEYIKDNPGYNFSFVEKSIFVYDHRGFLVEERIPNTGTTRYMYRNDGLPRFSQNAEQSIDGRFSYIHYDKTGRPVETGEYLPCTGCPVFNSAALVNILENTESNGGLSVNFGTRYDVIKTVYDVPVAGTSIGQAFLRGKPSYTERVGETKSWFSYDERGRTVSMARYYPGLGEKVINYEYATNGNISLVAYQDGQEDAFYHTYLYDADARLKSVYLSKTAPQTTEDGYLDFSTLSKRAEYHYYLHGPLKRVEYFQSVQMPEFIHYVTVRGVEFPVTIPGYTKTEVIQGIDYVYTAQGWLKSINSHEKNTDPGKDENDLFGMSLHYYDNDYVKNGAGISTVTFAGGNNYYNGLIKASCWFSDRPGFDSTVSNSYVYNYDNRYQLSQADFGTVSSGVYTQAIDDRYQESDLSYDKNGNILSLKRMGQNGAVLHNLTYFYNNINQLSVINPGPIYPIPSYISSYSYNSIGQVKTHSHSLGSGYITKQLNYNSHGLVKSISGGGTSIQIGYDEAGLRYKKENPSYSTWYVRDAGGATLAVYDNNNVGSSIELKEIPVYGSGRIGVYYPESDYALFELTDHLGNVRVVLNEEGEREAYSDYYPYGLVMSPSEVAPDNYRYGYQGQFAEKDEETGWNTFELRMYDPVIGRWLGPDPYRQFYSAYVGMGNNPVSGVDPDGGKVNPIYDTDGNFLGTDDRGLQGEAIVMDASEFTQGMSHADALAKGSLYSQNHSMNWDAMIKLIRHFQDLPARPDWDGFITLDEANSWYREGKGQPLYVDASKIDLSPVRKTDFSNVGDSFYKNYAFTTNIATGLVYGNIKLTLINNNGNVKLGGAKGLLDVSPP